MVKVKHDPFLAAPIYIHLNIGGNSGDRVSDFSAFLALKRLF